MREEAGNGAPLHLAAIMRSRDGAAALRVVCGSLSGVRLELHRAPVAQALRASRARPVPDAVLLEIDPRDGEATRHDVALLAEVFAGTPLIATCHGAEVAHARHLMRLGALDLIPQPIERAELMTALSGVRPRAKSVDGAARSASRIVAFLKAGGGSGATTLAVQTAAILAARRTQGEPEVCLLDFDLQFGAAALALDLDDRVGLGDLLEARERIDGALLRSVMGHHESGLDVLAAPRLLMPLDVLSGEFVADCLALARAEYQSVVLDLPLAWTAWSHATLKLCDLIVLVVQLNVPGVRRARRQIEALAENGLGGVPLRLVLNRQARGWGARARRREAERALGRRFDFAVARDERAVREALNRGVPLARVARWSRATRDLRRLADGLALALANLPADARTGHEIGTAGGTAAGRRVALSEAS